MTKRKREIVFCTVFEQPAMMTGNSPLIFFMLTVYSNHLFVLDFLEQSQFQRFFPAAVSSDKGIHK